MSVWAKSWAYDQRIGKWRTSKMGKVTWKGDPGAKAVLVALAEFADENGYCYPSQKTLATMTELTDRSVREHLHNLEHSYQIITRSHRRSNKADNKGSYTSDGIWLVAPPHRLRPPTKEDRERMAVEPAEKFSVGEKRQSQRKSLQEPAENFSGEPLIEPSVEPSVSPTAAGAALDNPWTAKDWVRTTVDRCREVDFEPTDRQLATWGQEYAKRIEAGADDRALYALLNKVVESASRGYFSSLKKAETGPPTQNGHQRREDAPSRPRGTSGRVQDRSESLEAYYASNPGLEEAFARLEKGGG